MIRQPKLHLMVLLTISVILVLALVLNPTSMTPTATGNAPVAFGSPRALASADGEALFEQRCKSCHTIGGGRTVGPDLKGVTSLREKDWLVSFITVPDRLIAQGDPIAKQILAEYGLPMPNMGVSIDEAKAILAYIEMRSNVSSSATPPPASPAGDARTEPSPDNGKQLFTGENPFGNKGPSCLSCHNVEGISAMGGGTTGKDLTSSYAMIGETGLTAVLKATPFPMMKEIYSAKPLTDDEIANLVAFLKEASAQPRKSAQNSSLFLIISAAGAMLVIGIFQFLWRGRLSGVRRPLVKGGSR